MRRLLFALALLLSCQAVGITPLNPAAPTVQAQTQSQTASTWLRLSMNDSMPVASGPMTTLAAVEESL